MDEGSTGTTFAIFEALFFEFGLQNIIQQSQENLLETRIRN